jgi:hypothetical protein
MSKCSLHYNIIDMLLTLFCACDIKLQHDSLQKANKNGPLRST